jgi:hypothetical protein
LNLTCQARQAARVGEAAGPTDVSESCGDHAGRAVQFAGDNRMEFTPLAAV